MKKNEGIPKFKSPSEFSTPQEITEETARALDLAASHYAHAIFRDRKFRELAQWDDLSQVEQDRIFNELLLACLVLIMLSLEAPDLRSGVETREEFIRIRDEIPKAHVRTLGDLGLETKHLKDWEKLIQMRFDEYARDRHDVRSAAMEIESREKELDLDGLSGIQLLVPLNAVAIGTHHHICRSKTDGRDELFKCLLKHLSRFYVEFRVIIEGGRITKLKRLRVAVRRAWRRLWR